MKEIVSLYGNSVTIEFEPGRHRYRMNGEPVPSVTTVLGLLDKSQALTSWAANLASDYWLNAIRPNAGYGETFLHEIWKQAKRAHRERKQEAASLGGDIHQCLEQIFKTDVLTPEAEKKMEDRRVRNGVDGVLNWLKLHQVEKLAIEKVIYSKKHHYAGRLDKKTLIDGKLSILDWKSGKNMYREQIIQQSAYLFAEEEETGTKIQQAVLIHVDKETGDIEPLIFARKDLKPAFKVFTNLRKVYEDLKSVPEPKIKRKEEL